MWQWFKNTNKVLLKSLLFLIFGNELIFRMYKNANHHGCDQRLSESEMCYERTGDEL